MTNTPPELDRLVHEPARLHLMTNLYVVDEADFVYLSNRTGLTAGNISAHMSKLEDAGYVAIEKSFAGKRPRTTYRLTDGGGPPSNATALRSRSCSMRESRHGGDRRSISTGPPSAPVSSSSCRRRRRRLPQSVGTRLGGVSVGDSLPP